MPNLSIKDQFRTAVETGSNNKLTVLYDDLGYPSIMFKIPFFITSEIVYQDVTSVAGGINTQFGHDRVPFQRDSIGQSTTYTGTIWLDRVDATGPGENLLALDFCSSNVDISHMYNAFTDNCNYNSQYSEAYLDRYLYLGAYKSSYMGEGDNKRLVSLPGRRIATETYNTFINDCFNKNPYFDGSNRCEGWHMMTAWERSAMILYMLKNNGGENIYNHYTIDEALDVYLSRVTNEYFNSLGDAERCLTDARSYIHDSTTYIGERTAKYQSTTGEFTRNGYYSFPGGGLYDLNCKGLEFVDGIKMQSNKCLYWLRNNYFIGRTDSIETDTAYPYDTSIYFLVERTNTTYNGRLNKIWYSDNIDHVNDYIDANTDTVIYPNNSNNMDGRSTDLDHSGNANSYSANKFWIQSKFSDSCWYGPLIDASYYDGSNFGGSIVKTSFAKLLLDGKLYRDWFGFTDNTASYESDRIFIDYDDSTVSSEIRCFAYGGDTFWNPGCGLFSWTNLKLDSKRFRENSTVLNGTYDWCGFRDVDTAAIDSVNYKNIIHGSDDNPPYSTTNILTIANDSWGGDHSSGYLRLHNDSCGLFLATACRLAYMEPVHFDY